MYLGPWDQWVVVAFGVERGDGCGGVWGRCGGGVVGVVIMRKRFGGGYF